MTTDTTTTITTQEARTRLCMELGDDLVALLDAVYGTPAIDTKLPAYQQRVIAESVELRGRLRALEAFIQSPKFGEVAQGERELMLNQRDYMGAYLNMLARRMALFGMQAVEPWPIGDPFVAQLDRGHGNGSNA